VAQFCFVGKHQRARIALGLEYLQSEHSRYPAMEVLRYLNLGE